MPPKKDKKKVDPDESTNLLLSKYKRKCDFLRKIINLETTQVCKYFVAKVKQAVEDQGHLVKFHLSDELEQLQIQAIFDTLSDSEYKHLKSIRLWKVNTKDQGLLPIVEYIKKMKQVEKLDLLDNHITPQGCAYLHDIIQVGAPLLNLKLDHNMFGTKVKSINPIIQRDCSS